ncbi:transglutaminase-like domain-containing protein [Candidatus Woesearchaeota archaeon]|nr:transglutaminase-like domain-containing protein [Candidatus Woesearchaeota archaeon]
MKETELEIIEEEQKWYHGPLKWIMALFLLLILVSWTFANYAVKVDPEPKYIPSLAEVVGTLNVENISHVPNGRADFKRFINPNDPEIKRIASTIASISCGSGQPVCQAKAIYYFVQQNIDYVSDPDLEYVESAKEVLKTGASDCDGMAVLLANLEQAIGVEARLAFIPNHVYVELRLPEGPNKYHDWFPADATCKSCKFGETSADTSEKLVISI